MNNEYMKRKFEYHEGYYAVGNNIPYDENQTDSWKEGYRDGYYSIYDEEFKEES